MSTQLATINNEKLKCRWQETYVSEALNTHTAGFAGGIVYGFLISTPSARNIRFSPHTELGLSIARVRTNNVVLTYRETATVTMDLSSFGGTTIYIGVTTTYTTGDTTVGAYVAYTQAEYEAGVEDTIWLCKVNVPGSPPLAETDIDTSIRSRAWAEYTDLPDSIAWLPVVQDPALVNVDSVGDEVGVSGDGASEVTTTVSAGVHSLRFYLDGAVAGDVYRLLHAVGVVQALRKVRCRFTMKATGATADTAGVYLRFRDKDFEYISATHIGSTLSATTLDWTTYTYEVGVPTSACYVEVGVGVTNLSGGSVRFEMVQVWTEAATAYLRGGQMPLVGTPAFRLFSHQDTAKYLRWDWISATEFAVRSVGGGIFHVGDDEDGTTNNIDMQVHGKIGVAAVKKFWTVHGASVAAYRDNLGDWSAAGAIDAEGLTVNDIIGASEQHFFIPVALPVCTLKKLRLYGRSTDVFSGNAVCGVIFVSQSKYPSGTTDVIGSVVLAGADDTDLKIEGDLGSVAYDPDENDGMLMVYVTMYFNSFATGEEIFLRAVEIEYEVSTI